MSGNPPAAVERFVREHRVARLGTVDEGGRPHVVPICYAYTRGRLYTPLDLKPKAAAPEGLRRVRNIQANPQVQVLIDDYDEDWSRLAFVQLRGTATLLREGAEYQRGLPCWPRSTFSTRRYPWRAGRSSRSRSNGWWPGGSSGNATPA